MTFQAWFTKHCPKDESHNRFIQRLSVDSGVSRTTFFALLKGEPIRTFLKALAVSKVTNGKVKPLDLMSP